MALKERISSTVQVALMKAFKPGKYLTNEGMGSGLGRILLSSKRTSRKTTTETAITIRKMVFSARGAGLDMKKQFMN
jgi:hypothetical protein